MKRYFVVSDIHSFYSPLIKELSKKGFDINNKDHVLIVCGDLFDRGPDSKKIYEFIKSLPISRRILIRGNHEYLFIAALYKDAPDYYDHTNGTVNTLNDLCDNKYANWSDLVIDNKLEEIKKWFQSNEWIDFYETDNYIFTHSFVPLKISELSNSKHMYNVATEYLSYDENWRECLSKEFENATWGCPWKLTKVGLNKTGKIIVCGHWHTSDFFNNLKKLKEKYNVYHKNPIFKSKKFRIIGLDACTAATNKINVLVLDEDEL